MAKVTTLQIQTPEGIFFSQLLATPVTRFAAWFIDWICVSAVAVALNFIFVLFSILSPDIGRALMIFAYFVLSIGYGIVTEWLWRGQTLGKRLLRLRVVDAQGLRLQFSQIVIRNLLRSVDMLPAFYLVGGVTALLSRRAQRLGDLAANTVVVRHPKVSQPDLDQLLTEKYNSLRQYPHLEARLRQEVPPAEAAVALQALIRRDYLEPQARVELFSEIATHFKEKVPFPPEAVEGITDEQYVRNVVDVLYRVRTHRVQPALKSA